MYLKSPFERQKKITIFGHKGHKGHIIPFEEAAVAQTSHFISNYNCGKFHIIVSQSS